MTKRLLIDASHAEETRVVVLDGNRLEDFDVETQSRRQLKGNIYLAKVVRVEPSLQAAFVEYGGNRHGFLAFGEIHPDYYQIPVADRQRLIALQEEEARAAEAEEDEEDYAGTAPAIGDDGQGAVTDDASAGEFAGYATDTLAAEAAPDTPQNGASPEAAAVEAALSAEAVSAPAEPYAGADQDFADPDAGNTPAHADLGADIAPEAAEPAFAEPAETNPDQGTEYENTDDLLTEDTRVQRVPIQPAPPPETIGGEHDTESGEDARPARQASRFMRSYKIQEVIRRRQILLVQVVKEERGTKGAALTTYISLAGRYCVLMPNSPRGGGISRKITSAADRRRLKEVTAELDIPRGMGLIVRTAGAARPKAEIKRDGEYLLRLWDDIREQTLRSVAPTLIYEEASLIKRAIRDVYSRDVEDLIVDGEDGWRAARDYMRMLMPAHVKKVQLWPAGGPPLFSHAQVENLLDSMLSPTVQLRSGGYLVINQTEALVAIDVNSGRSTRERGIEETALRTNMEAAEEAARQLRLRDLAGLIVIDFIDMESKKHNAMVERRMAEALKHDRARIQIGHISHFGLLELSRQRLRPSFAETSLNICTHCGGLGHVRSTESAALHVLREIEEEGGKRRASEILVTVATATALFILNNKRQRLTEIEQRYGMRVGFATDESLLPAQSRIDRIRAAMPAELPPPVQPVPIVDDSQDADFVEDEEDVDLRDGARDTAEPEEAEAEADSGPPGETAEEADRRRRRRRRRRRGGRREDGQATDAAPLDGGDQPEIPAQAFPVLPPNIGAPPVPGHDLAEEAVAETVEAGDATPDPAPAADEAQGRARRGRRGGRRRRKDEDAEAAPPQAALPYQAPYPAYVGPTPADPFAFGALDIFDVMEQAELRAPAEPSRTASDRTEPASPAPAAEPAITPDAHAAPELAPSGKMQVNAAPKPVAHEVAQAAPEPEVGPAVKPVLIGSEEASPAERKRGWWRR
jgi:ribonuclease E